MVGLTSLEFYVSRNPLQESTRYGIITSFNQDIIFDETLVVCFTFLLGKYLVWLDGALGYKKFLLLC